LAVGAVAESVRLAGGIDSRERQMLRIVGKSAQQLIGGSNRLPHFQQVDGATMT